MRLEEGLVGLEDVVAARQVIAGRLHRTPVVGSTFLGRQAGVRLFLKLESFQKTGSFKPRGVLNTLHHLTPGEKRKGVVTLSAGNHAQALAWAAAVEGIRATVVMPAASVRSKVEAARGYGGEVILTEGDLLSACLAIQKERDLTLVHPFDDPRIIAGQGTLGLEILEDVPEVDGVVVGCGGGGLLSGIATVLKAKKPSARIVGVEPEGAAAMSRSLERGEPVRLERVDTIADGLAAPFAGRVTYAHVKARVDALITVADRPIAEAVGLILERCKVLAEPAAAASVAGLLSGTTGLPRGSTVVCVLSGGNIDRDRLEEILR